MADPAIELRRFARIDSLLAAVIEGEQDIDDGTVENISLNGLYMHLHNSLSIPHQQRVTITIHPKKSPDGVVSLQARVVRTDSRGLAVHFLPMSLSDYLELEDLVDLMSVRSTENRMKQISASLIGRLHSSFGGPGNNKETKPRS